MSLLYPLSSIDCLIASKDSTVISRTQLGSVATQVSSLWRYFLKKIHSSPKNVPIVYLPTTNLAFDLDAVDNWWCYEDTVSTMLAPSLFMATVPFLSTFGLRS